MKGFGLMGRSMARSFDDPHRRKVQGRLRNDEMHGYSVHTFVNGSECEGTYKNGTWHGKGILTKPAVCIQSFHNGKFHGFGRMNP